MPSKDHHKRSIVKSLTFRVVIVIADFVIITAITHRYDLALGIIIFSNISSTVLYYIHERVWSRITWGRS